MTAYGYLYNLQGDVVALVDGTGTKVVEYTYDAWGKQLTRTGTMANSLGKIQPFRYRGYVYDEESGLYYLRSRYYRPGWGRFVSADALVKGNLYCYCGDNPVNMKDSLGTDTDLAYDRQKVLEYGFRYYNTQDTFYPPRSNRHNCVRFASQCLYEGLEDPLKYYNNWHCYNQNGRNDQTKSWRLTNPFYRFLCDSDLVFDEIHLTADSDIKQMLSSHCILPADFVLFEKEIGSDDGYDHAGVISTVTDSSILYMGNTDDCYDRPITDFFINHPLGEIVIMCMKDQG